MTIHPPRFRTRCGLRWRAILLARLAGVAGVQAEPYRPASDDEVLTVLPARRTDPAARELAALRAAVKAAPQDPQRALAAARAAYRQARALGDPRYAGQAQPALGPWWTDPPPPADIQVMRAVLNQYGHRFDAGLADLNAVVKREPGHAEAWSWLASIHLVRQETEAAGRACAALAPRVTPLQAAACRAQIDAVTGRAAPAAAALRAALAADPQAAPSLRLWALTLLSLAAPLLVRRLSRRARSVDLEGE